MAFVVEIPLFIFLLYVGVVSGSVVSGSRMTSDPIVWNPLYTPYSSRVKIYN
jgi:hypothetical protein